MDTMNRIIELLQLKGANQADLCKYLGIKYNVFTTWKTRGTDPPTKFLVRICEYFDITLEYLLTGKTTKQPKMNLSSDMQELFNLYNSLSDVNKARVLERAATLAELETPIDDSEPEEPETRFIEYSTLKVSAGTGQYLDTGLMEQMKIIKNELTADASFAVKITGDSMEPLYEDGEIVLVKSQPTVELGEVGIFIVGGLGYIKKLGEDRLISVNPEYNDILFHEGEEIYCKGLVIGVLEDQDILD